MIFFQVGYVKSGSRIVNNDFYNWQQISTFIGIAVHTVTATTTESQVSDLAAGVRQDAAGLLGTTLEISDLVSRSSPPWVICTNIRHCSLLCSQVIPFVAGGFLYIGAVAVLPTWVLLVILMYALLVFCHVSRQLSSSILMTRILFKRALSFSLVVLYFCKILIFFPSRLLAESKSTKQAMREVSTYRILLLESSLIILTVCSDDLRSRVHVHGSVGVTLILTLIDFWLYCIWIDGMNKIPTLDLI